MLYRRNNTGGWLMLSEDEALGAKILRRLNVYFKGLRLKRLCKSRAVF